MHLQVFPANSPDLSLWLSARPGLNETSARPAAFLALLFQERSASASHLPLTNVTPGTLDYINTKRASILLKQYFYTFIAFYICWH